MAIFIRASNQIVYLSKSGVVDDGVTDNSTLLQAILNTAQTAPLVIVNDMAGVVLCDGLRVYSNTTIESLRNARWKKKGYGGSTPGLGQPMFENAHIVPGGTTPTDQNIHFKGGYWDFNRRGYSSGGTVAYWTGKGDANIALFANNLDYVVPGIGFYGVTNGSAKDMNMYDLTCYGVHCGNVNNMWVENITKTLAPGDTIPGDNAVQMEGYCTNVFINGVIGQSNDDLVALNANDGNDIYPSGSLVTFQPGIVSGPCSDIIIRNLEHTGGAGTILRMLNANTTIKNITIECCRVAASSTSVQACIYTNNIGISGTCTYENITIRDVKGKVPATSGLILLDNASSTVKNLIIDGVSGSANSKPLVNMLAGTVSQFVLNNCVSNGNPYLFEITGGAVTDMQRGSYSASGLTADIHDAGSRITTLRRS